MASIPSNGYREVMAGTNVYTGSNYYGSICPQTPIAPVNNNDLVNKAYVTSVIPPVPPTPTITEFSYTNTSNAVVPVVLPTASLQKLNLLASGVNPGAWSNLIIPGGGPFGTITAFFIASDGTFWFGTQQSSSAALVIHTSADAVTFIGLAAARFDIVAGTPKINCFTEYGGAIFVGGEFDTLAPGNGGAGINARNIGRYDPPQTGFFSATQLGTPVMPIPVYGVNGSVNSLYVGDMGGGVPYLVAGGIFTNTVPYAIGSAISNLITMSSPNGATMTQLFTNAAGAFRVDGGGVNIVMGQGGDAGVFIGGSFTTAGPSFISQPYFTRINCLTGGAYGALIPSLNGAVLDMIWSSRVSPSVQDVLLLGGLFDLSAFNGSNGTAYFTFSTGLTSPAVANAPAVGGYKVSSVSGVDAVLFGATSILVWNNNASSTFWNNIGASGGTGVPIAVRDIAANGNFWTASGNDAFLRKYTANTTPAVATFQLPSARFRSATAPTNQYQNAVLSTAAGAQVFISGADLYWSPAGALTTGLTFT
jgi:hypothetical protein